MDALFVEFEQIYAWSLRGTSTVCGWRIALALKASRNRHKRPTWPRRVRIHNSLLFTGRVVIINSQPVHLGSIRASGFLHAVARLATACNVDRVTVAYFNKCALESIVHGTPTILRYTTIRSAYHGRRCATARRHWCWDHIFIPDRLSQHKVTFIIRTEH